MRMAICDDEPEMISSLKKMLLSLRSNLEIFSFTSAGELVSGKNAYDMVFLDIDMPDMSGMDAARSIREKKLSYYIVFITGHAEFMQEAFKVRAFRYINKPVKLSELESAVFDAEQEMMHTKKIVIQYQSKVLTLDLNDIICIEAFGDGTYIHTKNKVYISQTTLKEWCAQLSGKHFFQTHKSFLVALRYVSRINKGDAEMNGISLTVPVSRRKQSQFKEVFLEYIKNNAVNM